MLFCFFVVNACVRVIYFNKQGAFIMSKSPKKISLAYKIVFAVTIVFLLLYFVMLLVFGLSASKVNDADLKGGFGDVLKYHFSDIKGLFSFNFHNASNIIYFSLSGLLYFFILISVLYLVVGILLIVKRKRLVLIPGIVASLLVVFVFIMVATGTPKYWYIINQRAPFDNDKSLMGPTFGLLAFAVLYGLSAYVLYFYSVFIAVKNPAIEEVEVKPEETIEQPVEFVQEEAPKAEEAPVKETVKPVEPIANEKPLVNDDEPVLFEEVDADEEVEQKPQESKEDLKTVLAELVRDIVRDEIARNNAYNSKPNNQNPNGFGGPLIVQYFNTMPAEAPQPAPQPVKQEVKEQPQPDVKKEAAKQEVKASAPQQSEEKKPIIRIPFTERMLAADKEMQDNYNELKNEILSYGVNSRVSNSGDTFRLHRKTYIKITIAGLSLKLYFALNPDDYKDSTLPIQNAGHKGIYEEIPLVFKVKSGLSMRRCKQLIQDVFEKNGFEQGEIGNINWVEDLKNSPNNDDED